MKSERAAYRLCSTGDLLVLMRETRGLATAQHRFSYARERNSRAAETATRVATTTTTTALTNQSALNAQPLGCAVSLSQHTHTHVLSLSLSLPLSLSFDALPVSLAHAICFELSLWPLWLPYAHRRRRRQRCDSGGVVYLSSSASHWGFMPVLWLIFVVRRSNSNCNWALRAFPLPSPLWRR